jgi:hypothetical protein
MQRNYLGDEAGLYANDYLGLSVNINTFPLHWVPDPGSSASVVNSPSFHTSRFVIDLRPTSTSVSTIELDQTSINSDLDNDFIFHAVVYSQEPISVRTRLYYTDDGSASVDGVATTCTPGTWTAIFSNTLELGRNKEPVSSVGINIEISNHNARPIFITMPHLVLEDAHLTNQFVRLARRFIPDFVSEYDNAATAPKSPFMKLFHAYSAIADDVMNVYIDMFLSDKEEITASDNVLMNGSAGEIARSTLTDIQIMPASYMPYAAMFTGQRITASIPENVVQFQDTTEYMRWMLSAKPHGIRGGSVAALKAAVRTVLSESQSVVVSPLHDGNPFKIMVRTLTSETPGVEDEGDTSEEVIQAGQLAKPAGYVLFHQVQDEFTFILNDSQFGIFNQSALG